MTKMKIQRRFTRTLYIILLLLILGGATNEAWAKITYHILSLPISTKQHPGTNHIEGDGALVDFQTNVRVEVLRVVSTDLHVNLPFEYKSPLVTTYHYYAADKITKSTNPEQLYGYNNTKYYFYTINGSTANEDVPGNQLTAGDDCADNIHIYVTYDYNPATSTMDLSADLLDPYSSTNKTYNIHLKDRMVVLNQKRQNRPGAVLDGKYTPEQLASNEFEWITSAGINNGDGWRHFSFIFGGNDPYNVTIFTAYDQPTTFRQDGQSTFFTTDKMDKDKYLNKNVFKEYRGASFFSLMNSEITSNMWLSSEAHTQFLEGGSRDNAEKKTVPGYFKGPNDSRSTLYEMSPIFNSFAILNHTSGKGWALAGSKMNTQSDDNRQPKASNGQIQYLDYKDNGNTITVVYRAEASACKVDVYEVKKYIFRVKTPFGNNVDVDFKWSDYDKDETITTSMIPESLKRKYTNFTGNFYADAAHNTAVTTFTAAQANCSQESGKYVIYVDYEVLSSIPFEAIAAADKTTGYATATWYEITDKDSSGKKIKWNGAPDNVFKNNGGASEYVKESEFAFIGDPYELRIINRALTATASANRYVGSTSRTTGSDLTYNASDDGAGFKWEIPYDDVTGNFTLREFKSTDAYWQWNTSEGNNIQYSTSSSTRMKVMEIGKVTYTFNIVDLAGNIAIKATEDVTPFTTLTGYANIPASIRSPFLADETVTFYSTYSGGGRGNLRGSLTELPGSGGNIYVAYTTTNLTSKSIPLKYNQEFNVKLNGEYIYWDSSTDKILSVADPGINLETGESYLKDAQYLWQLRGRDPYAMIIDNKGKTINKFGDPISTTTYNFYNTDGDGTYTDGSPETIPNGMFVQVDENTWGDDKSLGFVDDRTNASRFIAMLSNYSGVYEVLAATGTTDYYHIGRTSTPGAETKIYSNSTYAHGADELRFVLEGSTFINYHLIDKSGKEIFRNEISSKNARLTLPAEYVSPLVASYHYYAGTDVNKANGADGTPNTADDIFTLKPNPTDLSEAGDNAEIYVFYDVDSNFGFGDKYPRLLQFLDPKKYYLEDGNDKLTADKIPAVYPYCNGDGSLNIYGQLMRDEQMNGGSSTRSRWVWFFESANKDPYHVKIHSKNTISLGDRKSPTYLHTFAVHFNQETDAPNKQRIVTGGNLISITQDVATEYSILGTTGRYKLMTTAKLAADLDGDGDTDGTVDGIKENDHRYVTSFEQYWKTYDMVKLCVLRIPKSQDAYSTDPATFEMPSEKWPDLKTALTTKGINDSGDLNYVDGCSWHSYDAVVNATRWNGYNDKDGADNQGKKKVERLEHWFQTFDMGDGTFDMEDANIPAVLVLLDRHGWEIMRKPLPTGADDPDRDEKLAALRAYDSPMVKEYKFYSNATKGTGCHKYVLRMQDDAERDPIKLNGKQYTSTSLADLPPLTASGVISSGAMNDQFVTYTVKEEYEKSYTYNLELNSTDKTYTESGTPSAFIMVQNATLAKDNNGDATIDTQVPGSTMSEYIIANAANLTTTGSKKNELWYLQPNLNIDKEMGIKWASEEKASLEPYTEYETKDKYKDKTGFDPYNLQIQNVSTGKYFTSHMTSTSLSGGAQVGDYTGTGGSTNVTLADWVNQKDIDTSENNYGEGYDHSYIQMSNQTFMAVQDANGNMQLMPRFDHSKRIDAFVTLANATTNATKASVDDNAATMGTQTTFFVRPLVFDYRIIDNDGHIAMRYKTAGESYPSMPEHFKSPLAKDFKFYKTLTDSNSDGVYEMATLADEITGSFAAADIKESANIYIRYSYDETYDSDHDNILRGRWMTMSLAAKDVQASGTVNAGVGTGVSLYTGTKDATQHEWQWKFLGSPSAATLSNGDPNPYYTAPDPYAVQIFNREANKDPDPTANPNMMGTGIKVAGIDRFVILNHPSGDYALCAAGDNLTYSFLNGGSMTAPDAGPPIAASVESENSFTKTANTITAEARVIFTNEVTHTYRYNIITVGKLLAASDDQDESTAAANFFNPVVPNSIQSQLINLEDYLYYGTATLAGSEYTIDPNSQIDDLYGLYDDVVYVHYTTFSRDNTPYWVPNERNTPDPTPPGSIVAVGTGSNDVPIDLSGNLPYNIIWYNDNMMVSTEDGSAITDGGAKELSAEDTDMWHFEGNDPYALKIKHKLTGNYIDGTSTLTDAAGAKEFMLLKKDGYDYGVLAETGKQGTMLTFSGSPKTLTTTTSDPVKFIPFALSVHHLIYHLVIAETCPNKEASSLPTAQYVVIPYREGTEDSYKTEGWKTYAEARPNTTKIYGSTQRDLTSDNGGVSPVAGEKYQLGETINGQTYSHDAGKVSIGDNLEVPDCFYRPNVSYFYYVEGIYNDLGCTNPNPDLNNKYKGLKVTKLMSNADLIGKTVRVNIAYQFYTGLETNSGADFVRSVSQNMWYTWEANAATPKLAQYTGSLQTVSGYATHYTNDYLWTPLGDPYGFKMYNRYMDKNLRQTSTVMTTSTFGEGEDIIMSSANTANSVYELLADEFTTPGYFLVHPVVNTGVTTYYMRDNSGDMELSTTPTEWTFGLSEDVMRPYYEGAGNVGGLNAAGETAYKTAAAKTDPLDRLMSIQDVVYNHDNDGSDPENPNYIVHYAPGYYRLHNQVGSEGISTERYASGYLHDIEKTAGESSTAIPMHFYSRVGTSTTFAGEGGLGSGFTETAATRGEIPIPATEYDPSTIFYFSGAALTAEQLNAGNNPTSTISTQGLNVLGNKMTTGAGTSFTITDIGGAIVALSGTGPTYLRYDQSDADHIYDLSYTAAGDESARWCMEPASKQNLMLKTHDGYEDYYYTTFCAPFDVLLPKDEGSNNYAAYICTAWDTQVIHPTKVPASGSYAEGKFVPAGTPVIIRTTDNTEKVKLTLPNASPSSPLTCIFTGKYLEQKLSTEISASDMVYTFGLPITGYSITTTTGADNGKITDLDKRDQEKKNVGFYINANPNKELGTTSGEWDPNNRYVLHNKIYYRTGGSGASARQNDMTGIEFVPVLFDGENEPDPNFQEQVTRTYPTGVFDLQGRKVATEEEVQDGTWRQRVAPGIYIVNGKKIAIK